MNTARIEGLSAAAMIAAASALLWTASQFPLDSRIFPFMVLGGMLICAVAWLGRVLLSTQPRSDEAQPMSSWTRLVVSAGLTTAYVAGVSLTSYFIPTIIYIPLMAFVLGSRNWMITIPSAVAFAVGVYLIFVWTFERPIPLI